MNSSMFEGNDIIITDTFLSDDENEEEVHNIKKKATNEKNNCVRVKKSDSIVHVANDDNLNSIFTTNYDKPNDEISSSEESYPITRKDNKYEEIPSNQNEVEGFFNFENYLNDTNGLSEEEEKGELRKRKRCLKGNKAWHDSDDDVTGGVVENSENEISDKDPNEFPHRFAAVSDNDSEDGIQLAIEQEEDEEKLIKNEQSKSYFEKYIENIEIETYESKEKDDPSSNINMEDVYIFDDKEMDVHIKKKKKINKMNEKNIFLKYHLQKFTFHQIEDKKIKQLVGLPKAKLILSVYNSNLHLFQYKDRQLTISKKICFSKNISHVQEHNGDAYILLYDNYIRNYNLEKGMVYKNRIHYGNTNFAVPKEIKFFDDNNEKIEEEMSEISKCSNDNLYGISFRHSGKINVYDTRCYDVVKSFEMDYKYIGMSFHKKTNSLFGIDNKGNIYNWCLNSNKLIDKVMDNYSVFPSCFNIYDDYLVTGSYNGFLNLFDVNNLKEPIKSFKNLTLRVSNAIFNHSHNCLLYYTKLAKNGIKLIDLKTNYVYCNVPWFNVNMKYNILAADFFNNGNNLCFSVKPNSFYLYDIFGDTPSGC
ncbi:hypothetical protein, conserved [Plasmodium gonderi]|uniref:Uncharacterized protein n=1 Tax=Plasmodium gonderi TaxID=77519 RepID=A0A1Y1JN02_PLAGO|nr:hypothetical protein, conserved [Plasmodium gonderi]GAW83620.1 hypothetical protein, conserved [Plasmodium gonderi]